MTALKYRFLNAGELIVEGDEFQHNGEWHASVNAGLGLTAATPGMYRRLVTPAQQRTYTIPRRIDEEGNAW